MEPSEPILVTTAVDEWLNHNHRFTESTQKNYRYAIRKFVKSLPASLTIDQLTRSHIETYLDEMVGRLSNNSFNFYLITIKSFCRFLSDHYDLPNIAQKVKKLPGRSQQRFLSDEEYRKVLAVCLDGERDTVQFLANTGLRADELLRLDASNITPDRKFLSIIGKGLKRREIPLNDTCKQIIERHPNLKLSKSYMYLYRLCQSLAGRADIKPFGPHALRHYFATSLMRRCKKGVSIYRISKVLGHSSIKVTEKLYLHFVARIDLEGLTDCLDE